jgi:RNA polymerase sigma-70 factor (ECF subfamily)
MGVQIAPPNPGSFAVTCSGDYRTDGKCQRDNSGSGAIIAARHRSRIHKEPQRRPRRPIAHLATERELSDFLKSVEKRAYKRSVYHVRDEEAALDIVQESMMKLAEHYGDKPAAELPMLFQRILSNCTLDWFRRQKTRKALFSNLSDFESANEDGDFDLLETYAALEGSQQAESAEDLTRRAQILREIETEIQALPARQREAFLMRYWEDMDVAETAAAMGCSEGSVKTHCSRAVQALSKALKAKGLEP